MTDSRKVLESTQEPASLDRTMPAPPNAAEQGANLGGITKTADSGLRSDQPASGESPQPSPALATPQTTGTTDRSTGSDPARRPIASDDAAARADAASPEDESALESLGRAIAAPLDGEASAKEPRR